MTADSPTLYILRMKKSIIQHLSTLENGYCASKSNISKATGIPVDILTILLKRLKDDGYVQLMNVWSEQHYRPDGSGYCLTDKLYHGL